MTDRRRQFGAFTVVALVLLRLAIGWHFYREGSSKLEYVPSERRFEVVFSAEPFLSQAKGPLASWFQSFAAPHDWPRLLSVAPQDVPSAGGEAAGSYQIWEQRIVDDWQGMLTRATEVPGLTDEQQKQATDAFAKRRQQLADYLEEEAQAIAEYRHELLRLKNMRKAPEAGGAPFQERRIDSKAAQTASQPLVWVQQVTAFERAYVQDLRDALAADPPPDESTAAAIEDALTTTQQKRLRTINVTIAALTVGVGICLLVGLFTRLASVAGAVFLLGVIAAQPPWVSAAEPTYYQTVELAGLLVLAGTGAGRWAGLDFFGYAFCSRFCRRRRTTE